MIMKEVEKTIEKAVDSGTKAAKKSADEWVSYIQEHPMQSIVFGAVIYLAVKGLLSGTFK